MKIRYAAAIFLTFSMVAFSSTLADRKTTITIGSGKFDPDKIVEGSGKMATQSRDVKPFTRIKTELDVDVYVTVGEPLSVKITFDSNLVDLIETNVQGQTLELTTHGSFATHNQCRAEITLPSLKAVIAEGSGDIELMGVEGSDFLLVLEGSGNIRAMGFIENLEIELSGSGDIDTRELKSHNVQVELDGSGDIVVYADQLFDGSIGGSGNITYYGEPKETKKGISGSGKIRRR
ncbi:MAG TPA: head GIN domain-containing protein [candidate division Zixibacteria bacterium]|nr:head GIN domain-containing protein [candidate division Zixibacteria bacterium]